MWQAKSRAGHYISNHCSKSHFLLDSYTEQYFVFMFIPLLHLLKVGTETQSCCSCYHIGIKQEPLHRDCGVILMSTSAFKYKTRSFTVTGQQGKFCSCFILKNNAGPGRGPELNPELSYASQTPSKSSGILIFALLLHSKMFSTAVCSRQAEQLWLGHFLSSRKQPRLCLVPGSVSNQLDFFQPAPSVTSKF